MIWRTQHSQPAKRLPNWAGTALLLVLSGCTVECHSSTSRSASTGSSSGGEQPRSSNEGDQGADESHGGRRVVRVTSDGQSDGSDRGGDSDKSSDDRNHGHGRASGERHVVRSDGGGSNAGGDTASSAGGSDNSAGGGGASGGDGAGSTPASSADSSGSSAGSDANTNAPSDATAATPAAGTGDASAASGTDEPRKGLNKHSNSMQQPRPSNDGRVITRGMRGIRTPDEQKPTSKGNRRVSSDSSSDGGAVKKGGRGQ